MTAPLEREQAVTAVGAIAPQRRTVAALAEIVSPGQHPTDEQARIIGAGTEPTLVVAGAGSGKTETLSMRIVYLLDHADELFGEPISPEEILCLTFTRKAAAEIAARLLMPPIDQLEQIEAMKNFLFHPEGRDEDTVWFAQTVMTAIGAGWRPRSTIRAAGSDANSQWAR